VRLLGPKKVRVINPDDVGTSKTVRKGGGASLALPKVRRNPLIEIIAINTGCLNQVIIISLVCTVVMTTPPHPTPPFKWKIWLYPSLKLRLNNRCAYKDIFYWLLFFDAMTNWVFKDWLTICDEKLMWTYFLQCTYCKTKHARGVLGSYPIDEIVARAKQSFEEGVIEIWLTSEDLGAYGRDIGVTLPDLLWKLVEVIPENCRLRLGMTNPPYILDHLVPLHYKHSLCPYRLIVKIF